MNIKNRLVVLIILVIFVSIILNCSMQVYMLDMPVSDPIMYARDNQNSDLGKVEDGGYSGVLGECPT
ncbi:hypothetical protein ACFL67_01775 [candidate division KSB1 bacterium]